MLFKLVSDFKPKGDQPTAIKELSERIKKGTVEQTLLGVTGSGKTFTMANVVEKVQKPTLVMAHNKTLAAQLYSEFKEFFPDNAVHYFVSYYDYYQPEAYIPRTDTYIEKDSSINDEIDRLRLAATSSLLTRKDVLIVASVSAIYGIGEPQMFKELTVTIKKGEKIERGELLRKLINIQYHRNDIDLSRGNVRARGDTVEVYPSNEEFVVRIEFDMDSIGKLKIIDPLTGEVLEEKDEVLIFPARHWVTPRDRLLTAITLIQDELKERVKYLKRQGMLLEAQRIEQRTKFDMEILEETGICHGVENYSRHLSGRSEGDPPTTLIDYFPKDFLLFVDESHMTIPQIRGMYNGDRARKQTLVDYGFRLPSALDNRPLKFEEYVERINQICYVSATPAEYELSNSTRHKVKTSAQYYAKRAEGEKIENVSEQIIRPTGLVDPEVDVRPTEHQIDDVLHEVRERTKNKQRVMITTLTKRMSEDLTTYLKEHDIKAEYLHSDVATLERTGILRDLRLGIFDVIVGVNLLREGLDLPEVSLVIILDADKEGFLRSDQALIQTIGRAARHLEGKVIMYADNMTGSMKRAIEETDRRRKVQTNFNKKNKISPASIEKAIKDSLMTEIEMERQAAAHHIDPAKIPESELASLIKDLEKQMELAARSLAFEQAAELRDEIKILREAEEEKRITKRIKR